LRGTDRLGGRGLQGVVLRIRPPGLGVGPGLLCASLGEGPEPGGDADHESPEVGTGRWREEVERGWRALRARYEEAIWNEHV